MLQLAVDAQDLGYPSLQLTVDLLYLQTIRRLTLKLHPHSPGFGAHVNHKYISISFHHKPRYPDSDVPI